MKTLIFCIIFLIAIQSYLQASSESKHVQCAQKVRAKAAKFLAKKYNLSCIGYGGSMMKTVDELALKFNIYHPLEQEEARKLIVACTQDFLSIINQDQAIRPYLKNYPFTPQNVEIAIFSNTPKGGTVYDPYIGVVSASDGFVWYRTNDPNNRYRYKSKIKETFEEAYGL
jgi:hypothetical protein